MRGQSRMSPVRRVLSSWPRRELNDVDRLGSFSHDLLRWFASPFCPAWARDRLVYIEPAREDVVLGFNPLLYDTPAHGYFRVTRATDLVLPGGRRKTFR